MSDERPRKHVSHPVLRLDVLGPDGALQSGFRVFCRERQSAVAVSTCCACVYCEGVTAEPAPSVNCSISVARAERPSDPLGLVTPVGEVLASETFVVNAETTLRDALTRLHADDRRSVAVVDHERVVVGVLHDRAHPAPSGAPVAITMSARLTLPAATPVRRALELMAAAHLRDIIVVDENDVPLGTFRDVDGLHWLALARRGQRRPCAARAPSARGARFAPRDDMKTSRVADIMNPKLLYIREGDRLTMARSKIIEFGVTAIPILDDDHRPVGVISLRDLDALGHVEPSTKVQVVRSDATLDEAARTMADLGMHHLVVVDAEGVAVGMVSAIDFVRAFVGRATTHPVAFAAF